MPSVDLAIPVLPARDMAETIDFYKPLDFVLAYRHSELDSYMILRRGPFELQSRNRSPPVRNARRRDCATTTRSTSRRRRTSR